jgi:hypothetical protein
MNETAQQKGPHELNRKRRTEPNHKERAAREEARAAQAERSLFDAMGFWEVCRNKRCRRAHACAGDLKRCREEHWYNVPQETRSWIFTSLRAQHEGHSREEAVKIADAALARHRAHNPPADA